MSTMVWLILMFVVLVLSSVITVFIVRHLDENRLGEYQDKILKTQRDEVQSIYQIMRGWKHDYHNHMQLIKAHLSLNQIEEVLHYLSQLESDLDSIDIAIRTGNISIDGILSCKIALAQKKKIEVNCKAKVPERLTVSEVDLCVILGNLLDNAIEACEKIVKDNKFMRIYIGVFKNQLYISISNSTEIRARRSLGELISSKGGNHGHGLRRIDSIVKKYDGYVNQRNEPGVFATEVMLPL